MFKTLDQSVLRVQDCNLQVHLGLFWITMDSSITCPIHSRPHKCNHDSHGRMKAQSKMHFKKFRFLPIQVVKIGKRRKIANENVKSLTKSIYKWKQIWRNPVTEYCLHNHKGAQIQTIWNDKWKRTWSCKEKHGSRWANDTVCLELGHKYTDARKNKCS